MFPSWASRLASTSAVAALALIAAPGAKADVPETFSLSGNFSNFLGPPVPFSGTVNLDFSDDFTEETPTSIEISVQGHSVFDQGASVRLATTSANGVIGASNGDGDTFSLMFAIPNAGTWLGFIEGDVSFGDVVFISGMSGALLGASGEVFSNPAIPAAPIIDPPPISDPPTLTVPELSTWAMMLIGLAGLGLAAKRRRALGFLGRRA